MDVVRRKLAFFILTEHLTDIFISEIPLAQVSEKAVEPLLPNLDGMLRKVSVIADIIRVFREEFLIIHILIIKTNMAMSPIITIIISGFGGQEKKGLDNYPAICFTGYSTRICKRNFKKIEAKSLRELRHLVQKQNSPVS